MCDCKLVATPASSVLHISSDVDVHTDRSRYHEIFVSRMYLSIRVRPDISLAVNLLCSSMTCPTVRDMTFTKHVLRYLSGTINFSLVLDPSTGGLTCWADADWACDLVDRRSTTGI